MLPHVTVRRHKDVSHASPGYVVDEALISDFVQRRQRASEDQRALSPNSRQQVRERAASSVDLGIRVNLVLHPAEARAAVAAAAAAAAAPAEADELDEQLSELGSVDNLVLDENWPPAS